MHYETQFRNEGKNVRSQRGRWERDVYYKILYKKNMSYGAGAS